MPRAGWVARLPALVLVVSLVGWLHVIWNGEPRVMLVDDQGAAHRVAIDNGLTRSFGGLRALNQRRVAITGERESGSSEVIHVLTIELQADGR